MFKEMFDLTGRIAIVTGGSRGIGEAIALALSEFGAKVVLTSRKIEGLTAVKEKIEAAGGEAICIPAHMGDLDSLQKVVEGTLEAYGTIDILVNNAATNPVFGPAMEADAAVWDKILDVNLKGIFFLTREVGKTMLANQKGSVINISTEAAQRPAPGLGVYSISKAGLDMVTKVFAQEWGPMGVRVNGIAPGLVKTSFSKAMWSNEEILKFVTSRNVLGRMARPEEIAGAAVFLASDAASFITGETLLADAGSMLS
ncbi:MAG: glucose 1-dehydrogenase [Actinobacteria bacterium]|nr:glucose 1-dehydrogenase [Actinomycetota bacterium]MBU1945179.1 glucose 1-dehydrogenase [Actinomycetota bacterium]MBU2687717.1 glucose 1-dehydrogenase [Actinomycetota bacterium]